MVYWRRCSPNPLKPRRSSRRSPPRRQASNIQTECDRRPSRGGVEHRRGPIARQGAVQWSGDGGGKPYRAGSGRWPSQAYRPSQLRLQNTKRQDIAVSQLPHATAATPLSDGGSPSIVVEPKIATTVVSRGDSLWRISHVTYGAAMRYAVVYKANRHQIRNPNRIYPGQVFVLPMKAR